MHPRFGFFAWGQINDNETTDSCLLTYTDPFLTVDLRITTCKFGWSSCLNPPNRFLNFHLSWVHTSCFLEVGGGGEYSLAKWESEIASVDILSNVGYSIVFQPFFSSQHVPHLSAWAWSIISLIVFDDVFAQRRLKRLIDYSGHGGARSGGREGGWYWTRLFQDRVGIVKMVARSTSCHNGMLADKLTFSLNYVQKNVSY